jgi:hypothetical protein
MTLLSEFFLVLILATFTNNLVKAYSINDLSVCGKRILRIGKIIGGVESSIGNWGWQVYIDIFNLILVHYFTDVGSYLKARLLFPTFSTQKVLKVGK